MLAEILLIKYFHNIQKCPTKHSTPPTQAGPILINRVCFLLIHTSPNTNLMVVFYQPTSAKLTHHREVANPVKRFLVLLVICRLFKIITIIDPYWSLKNPSRKIHSLHKSGMVEPINISLNISTEMLYPTRGNPCKPVKPLPPKKTYLVLCWYWVIYKHKLVFIWQKRESKIILCDSG